KDLKIVQSMILTCPPRHRLFYREGIRLRFFVMESPTGDQKLSAPLQRIADPETGLREWLKIRPDSSRAHFKLGMLLVQKRNLKEAIQHLSEAARLNPEWAEPANAAAWWLATAPDAALRDGKKALDLGQRVWRLDPNSPAVADTLAAACAEVG